MPGVVLHPPTIWSEVKDWTEAILVLPLVLGVIVIINVIAKVREWRS